MVNSYVHSLGYLEGHHNKTIVYFDWQFMEKNQRRMIGCYALTIRDPEFCAGIYVIILLDIG
jgi:hypothetical protein